MLPERCLYEMLASQENTDFFSRKHDVLVFNPAHYQELARLLHSDRLNTTDLIDLCHGCNLCRPRIVVKNSVFRITRNDYQPPMPQEIRPLFIVNSFIPKDVQSSHTRITVVDDINPTNLAKDLKNRGFTSSAVWINPDCEASPISSQEIFAAICTTRPRVVIIDKGLGYHDGIELIRRLRDEGYLTIMYTGEWDTDETHQVADVFLTKPAQLETILEAIQSLGF